MIIRTFAAGLLIVGLVLPANAQSVPDDVRCLLLSNLFAKQGGDPRGRQAAAQGLLFFAGRLDGRANEQTIAATMRTQHATITLRTAATEMSTCAARMVRAQQVIQAAGRTAGQQK